MLRNILLRARAMWIFGQVHPHIDHAPDWTPDNAKELQKFMAQTETGRKFTTTLWLHVQSSAFRATLERNHAAYECGYASGARGICAVADSLMKEPPKVEQAIEAGETTVADLEKLLAGQ